MPNRALSRALHLLAHPATLVAIGLLLVNDDWLRVQSPSVWTGKLGDFAWLFFAPLLAAVPLVGGPATRTRFGSSFGVRTKKLIQ